MDDSADACADDATLVGEWKPTVSQRDEQVTEPDAIPPLDAPLPVFVGAPADSSMTVLSMMSSPKP